MKQSIVIPAFIIILALISIKNLQAQDSKKYLPNKPGSTKIESNLWQYSGFEKTIHEKNLAKLTNGFIDENKVLTSPKGFDLHVWYFGM